MRQKYQISLWISDTKGFDKYDLEWEDIPLRIGTHQLMEVVVQTPQGLKKINIEAKVSKF